MSRTMALCQFVSQVLLCAVVLEQFRSVFAFPLHAAALRDTDPVFSDASQRQWFREANSPIKEQFIHLLKDEVVQRLNDLGRVSDSEEFLERTFMSPAGLRAASQIRTWMTDAGLFTWIDDFGNVHGRFDGLNPSAPALLIGSHMDTVIVAGKFDGALGVLSAIAAVKALHKSGRLVDFPRPIEVIAFSDEEGVRFQSTFLGSGAIAGTLSPNVLQATDKSGVTVQEALQSISLPGTPASLFALKYEPDSVWGYVEIHIEQGPVLESMDLPLGVVDAIAGQTRLRVSMQGAAGHAGTVPMAMRRDPMTAAALAIVAIDELCMHPEHTLGKELTPKGNSLVCTVGEIAAWPGASNVIPGEVVFTVDVRAKSDKLREAAVSAMEKAINDICKDRAILCEIELKHKATTVECDSMLTEKLRAAASSATNDLSGRPKDSLSIPSISSGAGHDALAMAQLTRVGMIFVRCAGGISHSPLEDVHDDDVWAAGVALHSFLLQELESDVWTVEDSTHAVHNHHHTI
ncbi:unnamed protein product [Calypogeia fissa]